MKESSRENLCDIHIEEAERPNDKIIGHSDRLMNMQNFT